MADVDRWTGDLGDRVLVFPAKIRTGDVCRATNRSRLGIGDVRSCLFIPARSHIGPRSSVACSVAGCNGWNGFSGKGGHPLGIVLYSGGNSIYNRHRDGHPHQDGFEYFRRCISFLFLFRRFEILPASQNYSGFSRLLNWLFSTAGLVNGKSWVTESGQTQAIILRPPFESTLVTIVRQTLPRHFDPASISTLFNPQSLTASICVIGF